MKKNKFRHSHTDQHEKTFLQNLFAESDLFGYWLTPGSIVLIENCDKHLCAKIETIFCRRGARPKANS